MKELFIIVLIIATVNTTFYLTAYDPLTKQWAQAASSSGYTSFFPDPNWVF
jgi:hypothetical protein